MNNNIISLAKITAIAFLAIIVTSCGFEAKSITGSGKVTTSNRNIAEEFTSIDVANGIDVEVSQGAKSVIVEADDNLQPHIHTTVANGVLKISSDYGNYNNVTSKKVKVTMPEIRELNTSSGSRISSNAVLNGDDIKVKASSGSEIEVNLQADQVSCETSSGSNITVRGKALELETSSASGSKIDARGLLVNDVKAESSSGSSTDVHPIVSLNAKASSGGSIKYDGDPKKIEKDASSGGSVTGR
ncbi:MAG TPA: head GIN domain-containing protein [Flavobacterium sp.]|jgi:hypothetical protein